MSYRVFLWILFFVFLVFFCQSRSGPTLFFHLFMSHLWANDRHPALALVASGLSGFFLSARLVFFSIWQWQVTWLDTQTTLTIALFCFCWFCEKEDVSEPSIFLLASFLDSFTCSNMQFLITASSDVSGTLPSLFKPVFFSPCEKEERACLDSKFSREFNFRKTIDGARRL